MKLTLFNRDGDIFMLFKLLLPTLMHEYGEFVDDTKTWKWPLLKRDSFVIFGGNIYNQKAS